MKKSSRLHYDWEGEDASFADWVIHFCKVYLFPQFKFLSDGWTEFQPSRPDSMSEYVRQKMELPVSANYKDLWERVIVPSINSKYNSMKCNINNEIRSTYKGKSTKYLFEI